MIASHVLVALIIATNITPVERSQEKALQQQPIESKKESLRPRYHDFLLPFKEGYIKDESRVLANLAQPEKQDFNRRKCHRDVNFYGNSKKCNGKPNLRACGRK